VYLKYILSIDQGTSSSRAIIFDESGEVKFLSQKEVGLSYPQKGWVEQDPVQLVEKTIAVVRDVLEKCGDLAKSIAGVGITNQRETVIIWDKETGAPIYNAIVWQDRRTAK